MITRTIEELAAMLHVTVTDTVGDHHTIHKNSQVQVKGVSTDTRTVAPGNLFVPLIGENFDGHQYAAEAIAKGASACLWQEDRGMPPQGVPVLVVPDSLIALQQLAKAYREQLSIRIVGITGSNGETTTKDMVASVLSTKYRVHKTKGNFNNHIGLPLTLLQLDEQVQIAVLEMGMSGRGEIELLSMIAQPDAVIITMIGEAHMLQLGSREEISRAKVEILSGLREDGLFVYNGDEPLIERVLPEMKQPSGMTVKKFGAGLTNDYYPTSIRLDGEGTLFTINHPDAPEFYLPLLGSHNVINALAVLALAHEMGISYPDAAKGFRTLQMTSMRIEKLIAPSGLTVLNDAYNASPSSMKAALKLTEQLQGYACKRVVIGDMLELGQSEEIYHREIGSLLNARLIDYVYTYGPLSRYIADEAQAGYSEGRVQWYEDKDRLAEDLAIQASPQDVVLVKGSRGMRLETVVQRLIGG
jgi:UDP-N-acetylmuramoyl-tripeptide--D-alanyl-D-alanine ligase